MPALFIGHGSPMNVVAKNAYTDSLVSLAGSLPKPHAILVVSAHWVRPDLRITSAAAPSQLYDFFGFPDEFYKVHYEAPGSPDLAARAATLLSNAGFPCLQDASRGIDHAAWAVLIHMYPKADIPVVELSLDYRMKHASLYDIGAALSPLRDEGILLIGSGNIVHNLYRVEGEEGAKPYPWAIAFNELVKTTIAQGDRETLVHFALPIEASREGVPTPEHYLPLLAVLGSMRDGESAKIFHESFQNASIAMTGYWVS
jgi:4,5-DOPA dioxygenase extradiol